MSSSAALHAGDKNAGVVRLRAEIAERSEACPECGPACKRVAVGTFSTGLAQVRYLPIIAGCLSTTWFGVEHKAA